MKGRNMIVSTVPEHGLKTEEFVQAQTTASRVFGRDKSAQVVFQGEQAYVRTDGAIVYPSLTEGHMTKEEVLVLRGFADHESSHKRYTDMKVVKRFKNRCMKNDDGLLAHVQNAVDDIRVDTLAIRDYSGAQTNLEATTESTMREFLEIAKENPEIANNMDQVLPLMIVSEGRRRMGYKAPALEEALGMLTPENAEKVGKYTDAAMACRFNADPNKGTKDTIAVARAIVKAKDADDEEEKEEETSARGPGGGGMDGDGKDGGGDSEDGATGTQYTPGSEPLPEDEDEDEDRAEPEAESEDEDEGEDKPPVDMDDLRAEALRKNLESHTQYDGTKWRVFSTEYDAYDRVDSDTPMGKYMAKHASIKYYEKIVHSMRGKTSTMSRKLERALLSKQRRDWRTNTEFGALDPKRLVQASMGKVNVFRLREERQEIDTAVSMMIDLSGSMIGYQVDLAQKVAIALSLMMEKVGVAYEVLGWNNFFNHYGSSSRNEHRPGRASRDVIPKAYWDAVRKDGDNFSRLEPMQIYEFKSFDRKLTQERAGMSVINKCAHGNNVDSDAVKVSAQHLRHRHEKRKILFVLSDGAPAGACGAGGMNMGVALRQEIDRLSHIGVECVGIGIDSDAVARYYPQYVVVRNLEDLPKAAFDQMAKLLMGDRFVVDNSDLMKVDGGA